ncbi:MAG: diacylglycerol kinase family protein [Actinomycetota bacterium]|nr:diacylglycerol kinase family protein [Actinomycetota bacterium]
MTTVAVIAHEKKTTGGGLEELRAALADGGYGDPIWYEVPKSRKAPKKVRKALDHAADVILLWGGDGTVQRSVDELVRHDAGDDVTVGTIPAGTANLLATNLGVPTDVRAAVEVALGGARRSIDAGVVNEEHFLVMAGTGFDAMMIRDADRGLKDRFGRAAYVWTGAANLENASAEVTVEVDGETWYEGRTSCVLTANVGTIVGGIEAFPDARADDGLLEIGVIEAGTRWEWLRVLGRATVDRADRSPLVATTRGSQITVRLDRRLPYELDGGDRDRANELNIRVKPRAVTIAVPAPTP